MNRIGLIVLSLSVLVFGLGTGAGPVSAEEDPGGQFSVEAFDRDFSTGDFHYRVRIAAEQRGACSAKCSIVAQFGHRRPDGTWRIAVTAFSETRSPSASGQAPWTLAVVREATVAGGANVTHARFFVVPFGTVVADDAGWVENGPAAPAPTVSLDAVSWSRDNATGLVDYDVTMTARNLKSVVGGCYSSLCGIVVQFGHQRPDGTWYPVKTFNESTSGWGLQRRYTGTDVSGWWNVTHVRAVASGNGTVVSDTGWIRAEVDAPAPTVALGAASLDVDPATGVTDYSVSVSGSALRSVAGLCWTGPCTVSLQLGYQRPDGTWRAEKTFSESVTGWSYAKTYAAVDQVGLFNITHARVFAAAGATTVSDTGWIRIASDPPAPKVNLSLDTWVVDATTRWVQYEIGVEARYLPTTSGPCYATSCQIVVELGTQDAGAWVVTRSFVTTSSAWLTTFAHASTDAGLAGVTHVRGYLRPLGGTATASDTGPLPLTVAGGVRVPETTDTLLAAGLTLAAVCNSLTFAPASGASRSSVNEAALACNAARGTGATVQEFLLMLAAMTGGSALVQWVLNDAVVTGPRPNPNADPEAPQRRTPPVPPTGATIDRATGADALAADLGVLYPDLEPEDRLPVARQCLHLLAAAGLDAQLACRTLPIFVSGRDVAEATDHDIEAITGYVWDSATNGYVPSTAPGYTLPPMQPGDAVYPGTSTYLAHSQPHYNPQWVLLHWEGSGNKDNSWYRDHPACAVSPDDCDEFPLLATEEGGRPAQPTPHLRKVDFRQNRSQGGKFGGGRSQCGLQQGVPPTEPRWANSTGGTPLVFLPIPAGPVQVDTQWLCETA